MSQGTVETGPIYRGHSKQAYAEDFALRGRFRLGLLESYRRIDDPARTDVTEGLGHYESPNGMTERFSSGNYVYILSASTGDIDQTHLRQQMGAHVTCIDDPQQLAADVGNFLVRSGIKVFGRVRWRRVDYSKGDVLDWDLDPLGRMELSLVQKPAKGYKEDCETRLVAILNVDGPNPHGDYIHIDLNRKLPYVSLLTPGPLTAP